MLLPYQDVKVARESAVLQSLHDLQHPDVAASVASLTQASSFPATAGATAPTGVFVGAVVGSVAFLAAALRVTLQRTASASAPQLDAAHVS